MKKLLSLLILPIFAIIFFVGCGEEKTFEDIRGLYSAFVKVTPVEDQYDENAENLFFSNSENKNTITIKYPEVIVDSINNPAPINDMQYRYRGLYYQQEILNSIFNFYEKHYENFYVVMSSNNDKGKEDLTSVYEKLNDLKVTLEEFKSYYDVFVDSIAKNNTMRSNLTNYTFRLNVVIHKSFDFINEFKNVYLKYCVEDLSQNTVENLNLLVDIAYIDVAYTIFNENIESFNYTAGNNGECDLAPLFAEEAKDYNILNKLCELKTISINIQNGLVSESANHNEVIALINNFRYAKELFEQRQNIYNSVYTQLDIYTINKYRYGQVSGVDYETYLKTLSVTDRSLIKLTEEFINVTFDNYIDKLNVIIN